MFLILKKPHLVYWVPRLLLLLGMFLLETTVLSQQKDITYYKNLAEEEPAQALSCLSEWRDEPFAPIILEILAKKHSGMILQYSTYFAHNTYHDKIIEIAARRAVHTDPSSVLSNSKWFKEQSWAKEIMEYAGRRKPYVFISMLDDFNDQPWASGLITEMTRIAPAGLLFKYRQSNVSKEEFIRNTLANSQDTVIQIVLTISGDSSYSLDEKLKMLALIHNMVYNNLSLEDAVVIVRDPAELLRTLVEIHNQPNFIGKYSVENILADICVREAVVVNDLHDTSPDIRFASVKKFTALEFYILMVYSEKEIYTSTFNGFFDRFLAKMKKEKKTGDQLLQDVRFNKFKIFVEQLAYFNRLNDFLNTLSEPVQNQLLESVVKNLDKEEDFLTQAVTVADTFGIVQGTKISNVLRDTLNREALRVAKSPENREGNLIYGILVQMFGKDEPINNQWVERVAKEYNLTDPLEIPGEILFPQGYDFQQYFFYDDLDGHNSFLSFLHQYKNQSSWNVEQNDNYVHITSVGKDSVIEIYANDPDKITEGIMAIDSIFHERKVVPLVIVHRGHSYHVDQTLDNIPHEARIVYLGSCGGSYNVEAVLQRAPLAHIITTKGTGSALINDPLLKLLNDNLYDQSSIDWPSFWSLVEKKLGNNISFKEYIPPYNNLAVLFFKIYFKELQEIQTWD